MIRSKWPVLLIVLVAGPWAESRMPSAQAETVSGGEWDDWVVPESALTEGEPEHGAELSPAYSALVREEGRLRRLWEWRSGVPVMPLAYSEGPGFVVSDGVRVHVGVASETRYDSNPLLVGGEAPDVPDALFLRIVGHARLTAGTHLDEQRVARHGGLWLDVEAAPSYREYFSASHLVTEQRAFEMDAHMRLRWTPRRLLTVGITNEFGRYVFPVRQLWAAGAPILPSTIARHINRTAALVTVQPTDSRLRLEAGYAFVFDLPDSVELQRDRLFHEMALRVSWRLWSKLFAEIEATQQVFHYPHDVVLWEKASSPLRLLGGVSGWIGQQWFLTAKMGYGNGFYDPDPSFSGPLATIEAGWAIASRAAVTLGYERSFFDALQGHYFADHRVHLGAHYDVLESLSARARAEYRHRRQDGGPRVDGVVVTEGTGNLVTLGASATWRFVSWAYLTVGYDMHLSDPDSRAAFGLNAYVADFTRHQVHAQLGLSY